MIKIFSEKKIIYLLPLALLLLGELYILFNSQLFFVSLALGALFITLTTKGLSIKSRALDWPLFLYFPLIFFIASSFYTTVLASPYLIQTLLLVNVFFIHIYFNSLYYFFRYNAPDRIDKLDTFLMTGSVLSIFFAGATAYALPVYLGWSFWPLLIVLAAISFPLFFQPFILGSLNLKTNRPFFIAALIIFTQIAGVIYLFPFSFNVLGLMLAIVFYVLFLILRLHIRGRLSSKLLKIPLIASLIIIILLLLTTRWF